MFPSHIRQTRTRCYDRRVRVGSDQCGRTRNVINTIALQQNSTNIHRARRNHSATELNIATVHGRSAPTSRIERLFTTVDARLSDLFVSIGVDGRKFDKGIVASRGRTVRSGTLHARRNVKAKRLNANAVHELMPV